uniref:B-cell receptor-associated protein 31 n=1 Tax=Triatoma infestans TaxID=30076 RepID=A0A161THT9_TRIIF
MCDCLIVFNVLRLLDLILPRVL